MAIWTGYDGTLNDDDGDGPAAAHDPLAGLAYEAEQMAVSGAFLTGDDMDWGSALGTVASTAANAFGSNSGNGGSSSFGSDSGSGDSGFGSTLANFAAQAAKVAVPAITKAVQSSQQSSPSSPLPQQHPVAQAKAIIKKTPRDRLVAQVNLLSKKYGMSSGGTVTSGSIFDWLFSSRREPRGRVRMDFGFDGGAGRGYGRGRPQQRGYYGQSGQSGQSGQYGQYGESSQYGQSGQYGQSSDYGSSSYEGDSSQYGYADQHQHQQHRYAQAPSSHQQYAQHRAPSSQPVTYAHSDWYDQYQAQQPLAPHMTTVSSSLARRAPPAAKAGKFISKMMGGPASTPRGGGDDGLRNMQRLLNVYYRKRVIEEDGIMGPETTAAVRDFQGMKSLAKNGTFDGPTHDLLVKLVQDQTYDDALSQHQGGDRMQAERAHVLQHQLETNRG
jgi:Putative peptidoglycan binding domain